LSDPNPMLRLPFKSLFACKFTLLLSFFPLSVKG